MAYSRSLWCLRSCFLTAVVTMMTLTTMAHGCSRPDPVSNIEMVRRADAIVRGVALEYAIPPQDSRHHFPLQRDPTIRFSVLEVIRGNSLRVSSQFAMRGDLVDSDDFNDQAPPYDFVRPNGRLGLCFAYSYRLGGEFLLFLKNIPMGGYTAYWYALAPTNEQLHSAADPWLLWVRDKAKPQVGHQSN